MFSMNVYCIVPNPMLPIMEVTIFSYDKTTTALALKMIISMVEMATGFEGSTTYDNPHFFDSEKEPSNSLKLYVSLTFPSFSRLDSFKDFLYKNGPLGYTSN